MIRPTRVAVSLSPFVFVFALTACPALNPPSNVECSRYDDIECPPGQVCLEFHCYNVCTTHSSCGPAEACLSGGCQAYTANCDPHTGSGCVNGFYCGSTGACAKQLERGSACDSDAVCTSGHCVDGVCCESACGGCQACSSALTSLPPGTCGNVAVGTDPHDACSGVIACDGAGACFAKSPGDECAADHECASEHCVEGVCCNDACDSGCESCRASITGVADGNCAPVPSGEDPNLICTSGYGCNGLGGCTGGFPDGTACGAPAQCGSSYCVDNVCCNEACDGPCANGCSAAGICQPADNGLLCRGSAGDCDALERCTGTSTQCPPDVYRSTSTTCRASYGTCDAPEMCTGTDPTCPSDQADPGACGLCTFCDETHNCTFDNTMDSDCSDGYACFAEDQCTVAAGTACAIDEDCGYGECVQLADAKGCMYDGISRTAWCNWGVDDYRYRLVYASAVFTGVGIDLVLVVSEDHMGDVSVICQTSNSGHTAACDSVTLTANSSGLAISGSCSAGPLAWD